MWTTRTDPTVSIRERYQSIAFQNQRGAYREDMHKLAVTAQLRSATVSRLTIPPACQLQYVFYRFGAAHFDFHFHA
jgi:hypothetical protein